MKIILTFDIGIIFQNCWSAKENVAEADEHFFQSPCLS
jgi:hypothetical protein